MKRYYSCKPVKRPNGRGGFVIEPELLPAIDFPESGTPGHWHLSASDHPTDPTTLVLAVSDRLGPGRERDGGLHQRLAQAPGVIDHGADFQAAVQSVRSHHGAGLADAMHDQAPGGE